MNLSRAYYSSPLGLFLESSPDSILGELARNSGFAIELSQRDAWLRQIEVLHAQLVPWATSGHVFLEFVVPRMGRRIDVLLVIKNVLLVVEFKVGESIFSRAALDQVWDYALDLKNFHEPSHAVTIAPVLVATEAEVGLSRIATSHHDDGVLMPIKVDPTSLHACIEQVLLTLSQDSEPFGYRESRHDERPEWAGACREEEQIHRGANRICPQAS